MLAGLHAPYQPGYQPGLPGEYGQARASQTMHPVQLSVQSVQLQASAALSSQPGSPVPHPGRTLHMQTSPLGGSPLQVVSVGSVASIGGAVSSQLAPSQGSSLQLQSGPPLAYPGSPLPASLPPQGLRSVAMQPCQGRVSSAPVVSSSGLATSGSQAEVRVAQELTGIDSMGIVHSSVALGVVSPGKMGLSPAAARAAATALSPGSSDGGAAVELGEADDYALDWVVWTSQDVAQWVESLLGPGLGAAFVRDGIDGPTLVRLGDDHLRDAMGIRDALQRAKLLGHLRAFRARRERLAKRAAQRKPQGVLQTPPSTQRLDLAAQGCPRSPGSSAHSAAASSFRRGGAGGGVSAGSLGAETPSMSVRGSFPLAPRLGSGPAEFTPGPMAYDVVSAESSSARTSSPIKATIGRSPRRTFECFLGEEDSPGPSCYDVGNVDLRATSSPRPTIGTSERKTCKVRETDIGPGPCTYRVDTLKFRSKSPKATIGNSRRDTCEFMVSRDAAESGRTRSMPSPRLGSPRGRQGGRP